MICFQKTLNLIFMPQQIYVLNINKCYNWCSVGPGVNESACNSGASGSVHGLGRSPGEGNGNPFQYSWGIPWTEEPSGLQSTGCKKSDTIEQLTLSLFSFKYLYLNLSISVEYFCLYVQTSLFLHMKFFLHKMMLIRKA